MGDTSLLPLELVRTINGVSTKLITAHPNGATKSVGVIALKRLRCRCQSSQGKTTPMPCVNSAMKCEVFKTAVCIQRPSGVYFQSDKEADATDAELVAFANHVKDNAWESPGMPWAALKASYKCDATNQAAADEWGRML
jgi:hypothetical protein